MQGVVKGGKTYTATEARNNFSEIVDAAHFGERVLVKKRGRQVAVVSMDFMERAEKLIEIEAELEAKAAEHALKEFQQKGGKTMQQIKQELGMD